MRTSELGAIGELKIKQLLLTYGIETYEPLLDINGADLLVVLNGEFKRVQIKTTKTFKSEDLLFYDFRRKSRTNGFMNFPNDYDVDYFFLYCLENDWCGIVDCSAFNQNTLSIRFGGGNKNSHSADDYSLNNYLAGMV